MSDQIRCPKCGSSQIHADKKGYSVGKAVAGVVLTGGIGLAAGAIGANKIKITCLKCGYKFNPGEGEYTESRNDTPIEISYKARKTDIKYTELRNKTPTKINYTVKETNIIICNSCGGRMLSSDSYCSECGKELNEKDYREFTSQPPAISTCKNCNQIMMRSGKYCSKCGKEKAPNEKASNTGCAGVILLLIFVIILFII